MAWVLFVEFPAFRFKSLKGIIHHWIVRTSVAVVGDFDDPRFVRRNRALRVKEPDEKSERDDDERDFPDFHRC